MKKFLFRLWLLALAVFAVDWLIVGLKLLNGDYNISLGVYLALVCVIVMALYPLYRALFCKCPYCGKLLTSSGRYCPHCGRELSK